MALNFRRPPRKGLPSTAPGERIYAIGDVHGRVDLLRILIERIERHAAALPEAEAVHLVLLGDLVDRGPETAQVLAFLQDVDRQSENLVVLMGNHEDLMLRTYDGERNMLRTWLRLGGADTLRSYGVTDDLRALDAEAAAAELHRVVPPGDIAWLRALPLTARSGDYFFCHAGVRPGITLARQSRQDLLWIRDDFLTDDRDHGAIVVHGHTIKPDVEMLHNRIGIDTGAYESGILTALYLEGSEREVIATSPADVASTVAGG